MYCGLLLIAALLGGCGQKTSLPVVDLPPNRLVATVYAVQADAGSIPCYRAASAVAPIVTHLQNQQHVEIASASGGLIKQGAEYWLRVYPHSGQPPACYVNIHHLVPVS
ncbi:hypothetical protein J9253_18645 [Thiothrix litoralis]|jgi:hypothetical protein|uniref:Lipoprotein n=1 Tax=Thiothrix litoralis TaxID=2891210 RepID=A0ABX7WUB2_9GAMM|nr:hypothetical protein [Thiothrix litoralis]QTR45978.1 hypothetical protein J9253_18645 [Thiothrix litoralis]